MKAQILNQLKSEKDTRRIDTLLDKLSIAMYLERFKDESALIIHLISREKIYYN